MLEIDTSSAGVGVYKAVDEPSTLILAIWVPAVTVWVTVTVDPPPPPEGTVCQVPLFARYWFVFDPKVIEELVTLDADSSLITNLSPDAIAAVAVISPPDVMLPCAWLLSAAPISDAVRLPLPSSDWLPTVLMFVPETSVACLLVSVGCTWFSAAYLSELPIAAVPSMSGVDVALDGCEYAHIS